MLRHGRERHERRLPDAGRRVERQRLEQRRRRSSRSTRACVAFSDTASFRRRRARRRPPRRPSTTTCRRRRSRRSPPTAARPRSPARTAAASSRSREPGFNLAGLEWVDFGDPTKADSQRLRSRDRQRHGHGDPDRRPGARRTSRSATTTVPVTVKTIAGLSNSVERDVRRRPIGHRRVRRRQARPPATRGPEQAARRSTIDGAGFADQALVVTFTDVATPFSFGTQYNFSVEQRHGADDEHGRRRIRRSSTPRSAPSPTARRRARPTDDPSDEFFLYPPGDPKIDSITPASGPASGGTQVTITGENLGCVTSVSFGTVAAEEVSNPRRCSTAARRTRSR